MTAQLLDFPLNSSMLDIPSALRELAEQIERGEHGEAFSLMWVIDKGNSQMSLGLMGKSPQPGLLAYYMAGAVQKKLLTGVGEV